MVPVKIHQVVIGLLVVVRKEESAFEGTVQSLLEAVADYASISLVNKHLFRALQEGADNKQAGEKEKRKAAPGIPTGNGICLAICHNSHRFIAGW